jgi:hypothetical protein
MVAGCRDRLPSELCEMGRNMSICSMLACVCQVSITCLRKFLSRQITSCKTCLEMSIVLTSGKYLSTVAGSWKRKGVIN